MQWFFYNIYYIVYIAHFVTKEKDVFLDQHKLQIFPNKDFLIDFLYKGVFWSQYSSVNTEHQIRNCY